MKTARELPDFVTEIKTPNGLVLAADYTYNKVHELEGEVEALRLIDLDREGLGEYKEQLERLSIRYAGSSSSFTSTTRTNLGSVISEIFSSVDRDGNGSVSMSEANALLLRLNSRLGRNYGESEAREFFRRLDRNGDGSISLREFRAAFERIL